MPRALHVLAAIALVAPGIWDLGIKWEADSFNAPDRAEARYGSIFTAVQEQFRLKFERRNPTCKSW